MSAYIIYKLTFPNNKIRIGQTNREFERRISNYKTNAYNESEKNRNYNSYISKAIRKYGWDNIKKEILFTVPEEFVDELETQMIAKYKSANRQFGYNLDGGGSKNKHISEETKKKISLKNKGRKHTTESKLKIKKNHYNNSGENNGMFGVCGNKHPRYNKLHSIKSREQISNSLKGKKQSEETKRKRAKKVQKIVNMYDLSENFIKTFESIRLASIELNVDARRISDVLCNRKKHIKGYVFKYAI